MPSGLRVTRIDRAPAARSLPIFVNGIEVGAMQHLKVLEVTVASGEVLLEVLGSSNKPLFQVLRVQPGCTARVFLGRSSVLGLLDASLYLHVEPAVVGMPDRSIYPLNLSAHSALEWLQRKRALGEPLTPVQQSYLQSRSSMVASEEEPQGEDLPSLKELGAFAALGLNTDAEEADIREAFRLLMSIHAPETGQVNATVRRLQEAFQLAMTVAGRRLHQGVTGVGR